MIIKVKMKAIIVINNSNNICSNKKINNKNDRILLIKARNNCSNNKNECSYNDSNGSV